MNNLNEKCHLKKQIQQYDFALYELQLYLDTHPRSIHAMQKYRLYLQKKEEAVKQYTKLYGPLQACQANTLHRWNWVDNPWPWEMEEE